MADCVLLSSACVLLIALFVFVLVLLFVYFCLRCVCLIADCVLLVALFAFVFVYFELDFISWFSLFVFGVEVLGYCRLFNCDLCLRLVYFERVLGVCVLFVLLSITCLLFAMLFV